jgi:hypothetical protein
MLRQRLGAPVVTADSLRLVKMAPMVLRRRMSRLARSTVKLVAGVRDTSSAPAWMFMTPTPKAPILPVSRPPTEMRVAPSSPLTILTPCFSPSALMRSTSG